ncbi:MAG: DNA-binding protein [Chloroflexota bacterium]|nr:MAG: DNA-binding protein [Chloroflexota bacterium]
MDADQLYTVKEVEELLGLSRNVVLRLLNQGELRGAKLGVRQWRIKGSDILEYYERKASERRKD